MSFNSFYQLVFITVLFSGCASLSPAKNQNLHSKSNNAEAKQEHICKDKTSNECNDMGVEFELADDLKSAEICYKIACKSELGVACSNLGSLYQRFDGHEEGSEVIALFLKACKLNSKYGCYNAGNSYRLGIETGHNFVRAIKLYEKACIDLKHSKSCTNLGGMHQFSLGVEGGSRDVARKYYKMGCELGDEVGCKNFSLLEDKF